MDAACRTESLIKTSPNRRHPDPHFAPIPAPSRQDPHMTVHTRKQVHMHIHVWWRVM